MLRKMYLISPEYLKRNDRSSQTVTKQQKSPLQKAAQSTKHNTRARVKRKNKKGPKHPYDKWIAMREEISEAAVGRKALIKAIADFIKVVLPDTTLTQKAVTPKSESVELGTQTTPPPPRSTPLTSTSSKEDVYEKETLASDDRDTSAVSEEEENVHKFARKSYGEVASPYLSPYVHKSGFLDAEYGLRKVGDKFFIGNSDVTVDANSDLYIKDKHFRGTRGLWELLTRKNVQKKLVSANDLKQYKSILNLTSAHLEGYEPSAPIHISKGIKFRTIVAKLFPQTKRRGIEASLRQQWEKY